eukprot:343944-Pelagomonas_calceolata.AAC.10
MLSGGACCWCACCSLFSAKPLAPPTPPNAEDGAASRGKAEVVASGLLYTVRAVRARASQNCVCTRGRGIAAEYQQTMRIDEHGEG